MELSILIAKILGLTYIAAGVAAISGKIEYPKMVEDFENSPGLTYLAGFVALIFGVILTHHHNLWVKDWRFMITLVGWLSLIKGIVLIAFPQSLSHFKGWYKDARIWGIIMIILGAILGYFGFFA